MVVLGLTLWGLITITDGGVDEPRITPRAIPAGMIAAHERREESANDTRTPAPTAVAQPADVLPVPEPVEAGEPAPVEADCTAGEIERLICEAWPQGEWGTAMRIARAESGVDQAGVLDGAWAVGDGSYGVFQLQASAHAGGIPDFWDHWMLPSYNVAWAYLIWADREAQGGCGWCQWSTY